MYCLDIFMILPHSSLGRLYEGFLIEKAGVRFNILSVPLHNHELFNCVYLLPNKADKELNAPIILSGTSYTCIVVKTPLRISKTIDFVVFYSCFPNGSLSRYLASF